MVPWHITSSLITLVSWWVSRPDGGQLIKGKPCHWSSWLHLLQIKSGHEMPWRPVPCQCFEEKEEEEEFSLSSLLKKKKGADVFSDSVIFYLKTIYKALLRICSPPHNQSMLWPPRRCECLSLAMTFAAAESNIKSWRTGQALLNFAMIDIYWHNIRLIMTNSYMHKNV